MRKNKSFNVAIGCLINSRLLFIKQLFYMRFKKHLFLDSENDTNKKLNWYKRFDEKKTSMNYKKQFSFVLTFST